MSQVQRTRKEIFNRFFPIYFYRKRLDIAARDILGLKLSPHHRIVLRDWGQGKHYNLFLAGRGMGKTILAAIYFVLISILYPKNKLMVVAGQGFRGSKFLLLEMEKIIANRLSGQKTVGYSRACLQDSNRIINRDPSFWSISFSNGSIVYGVPVGVDGQTIRGIRAFCIAQDEAFLLPSHLVQSVLEPMLNVLFDPTKSKKDQAVKSQSLKFSTIDYTFRDFYKEYSHYREILENGSSSNEHADPKDISLFEFNFEDSFYKIQNKEVTLWGIDFGRIIEKKFNPNTDLEVWLSENKNIPMDLSGGYFEIENIDKCSNVVLDEDKDLYPEVLDGCAAPCILGVDTAPAKANTAFVIIKIGQYGIDRNVSICKVANGGAPCSLLGKNDACLFKKYNAVIYAYEQNKMEQKDRVKKIYELLDKYNIIGIAMDARGGGYELADLLRDQKYIRDNIAPGKQPVYDPVEYPQGTGLGILKLFKTTQDDNLLFNSYLKALISNTQLLFPKPLRGRPDNPSLLEVYGHIETLVNQLARIKGLPWGKSLKFEIESVDPDSGRIVSGRKDLYSALLYAVGRLRELLIQLEQFNRQKDIEFASPRMISI